MKMEKALFIFLLMLVLQGCHTSRSLNLSAAHKASKVILAQEGPAEFLYWELETNPDLWSLDLGAVNALEAYRDSLALALGKAKFEAAVHKEAVQNLEKHLLKNEKNGDRINALLVHTDSLGQVRAINNLESQILNYQMERFPMFSQPTEFHAFITEHKPSGKIRVYFGASDTEWPPHPDAILDELEKPENQHWKLILHLHNHYCKEDQNYVGILAPSLADAQYYGMLKENYQLEQALITNGFHTVVINQEDFEKFESH